MSQKIKIPIFNQNIYLVDKEYTKKNLKNVNIDLYNGLSFRDEEERICFYCDKLTIQTLVHESVHLANFIIDDCLIHSTPLNDEVLAYLTTYIFTKLRKNIKKEE